MRSPPGLLAATAAILALSQVCCAMQREPANNHIINQKIAFGKPQNAFYGNPIRGNLPYETENFQFRSQDGRNGHMRVEEGARRRDERVCGSWRPALQFPPHTHQFPTSEVTPQYSMPSQQFPPPVQPVPRDERNYDPRGYSYPPNFRHYFPVSGAQGHPLPPPQQPVSFGPQGLVSPVITPPVPVTRPADTQCEGPRPCQSNNSTAPVRPTPGPRPSDPAPRYAEVISNPPPAPVAKNTPAQPAPDHQDPPQGQRKVQTKQESRDQRSSATVNKPKKIPAPQPEPPRRSHERSNLYEVNFRPNQPREPQPYIDDPQFQYQNNMYRPVNMGQPLMFPPQYYEKPPFQVYGKYSRNNIME